MASTGGVPRVELTLTWDGPPRMTIEQFDGLVSVVAHAELSETNVVAACEELDSLVGQAVLSAWRNALMPPR